MSNTIENLRKYNLWRRGDESIKQPDPKDIGIWIDEICEIAEKLERERDEAREALRELWQTADAYIPQIDEKQTTKWHNAMFGNSKNG